MPVKPKTTAADEVARLQAIIKAQSSQIASKDKKIASLESTEKKKKLIPKPKGSPSRSAADGGYNIQVAMGLADDGKRYDRLFKLVKIIALEHLPGTKRISKQDKGRLAKTIVLIQQQIPFFRHFEHGWPIRDIIQSILGNMHTRYNLFLKQEEACEEAESSSDEEVEAPAVRPSKRKTPPTLPASEEEEEARKKKKAKGKSTVSLDIVDNGEAEVGDDEAPPKGKTKKPKRSNAEDEDNESEAQPIRKSKTAIKPKPILSDAEDSDFEDLLTLSKTPRADKPATPQINKPTAPKADKKASKKTKQEPNDKKLSTPQKRKAGESEGEDKKKAKKRKTAPPPPTPPLVWSDLPDRCIATLCKDALPVEPVPKILRMFNRLRDLEEEHGKNCRGASVIQLEICMAITIEKKCFYLLDLGKRRNWPIKLDPEAMQSRIMKLDHHLLELFLDRIVLRKCLVWQEYLVSINYQIHEFSDRSNRVGFLGALKAKRCGYYGPKGEAIIQSCLIKWVAEQQEDSDFLSQGLCNTICDEVADGPDADLFDEYDPTSNYLHIDDFICFVLVPFVAIRLIMEDQNIDDEQDAIFERNNGDEFGSLIHEDDDTDEAIEKLHQQNVRAVGKIHRAKDRKNEEAAARIKKDSEEKAQVKEENKSSAPPRHRLKETATANQKVTIRLPGVVEEKLTLANFPSPLTPLSKLKPKPKPKAAKPKPATTAKAARPPKKQAPAAAPSDRSTRSKAKLEVVDEKDEFI